MSECDLSNLFLYLNFELIWFDIEVENILDFKGVLLFWRFREGFEFF